MPPTRPTADRLPVPTIRTPPPFRLLYDLRWMELGRAGGVEQATYELVAAIGRRDRHNAYRVFAPRSACWEWDFPPRFDVRRIYSDAEEPASRRFHEQVARADAGRLPAGTDDVAFDFVHSTCGYIHPELIGFPGIVTINDLQHLHYPQFFSKAEFENRERLYRESAVRARHVICISEFTRRDVHERYGVPLEKLTTVWIIPSGAAARETAPHRREVLLRRMGIEGPFLFYPAHCWPHKNHARLLEAFRRACAAMPREVKLVLTGQDFPAEHPARAALHDPALAGRVAHLGFRSPLEIRALLQECTALVFPSLFEGFGMPVAEAILAAKPVACSNVTSLPEIAGDAALMFDPCDVDDIAASIVEIATNMERRNALAAAARRRQPLFSAHESALKTLAVYEQVSSGLSRSAP